MCKAKMSQAMNSESVPSNGISDQNGDSTPQENASGKAHGHLTKENYTSDTSPVNDMGTATDYGSYKEPLPKRTPPRGAHEPAANYLYVEVLPLLSNPNHPMLRRGNVSFANTSMQEEKMAPGNRAGDHARMENNRLV
jgi:hypothetical protein